MGKNIIVSSSRGWKISLFQQNEILLLLLLLMVEIKSSENWTEFFSLKSFESYIDQNDDDDHHHIEQWIRFGIFIFPFQQQQQHYEQGLFLVVVFGPEIKAKNECFWPEMTIGQHFFCWSLVRNFLQVCWTNKQTNITHTINNQHSKTRKVNNIQSSNNI